MKNGDKIYRKSDGKRGTFDFEFDSEHCYIQWGDMTITEERLTTRHATPLQELKDIAERKYNALNCFRMRLMDWFEMSENDCRVIVQIAFFIIAILIGGFIATIINK